MQNFKAMESEGAIGRAIEGKMTDILEQFTQEIVNMRQMFDKNYKARGVPRPAPGGGSHRMEPQPLQQDSQDDD